MQQHLRVLLAQHEILYNQKYSRIGNLQQPDLLQHLFCLVGCFLQRLQRNNVNGTEDDLDKRM